MVSHRSAKPSHYNREADSYDAFNEKNSEQINQFIEKILSDHTVKTVLDLTCGTGSQVLWLARRGFEAIGVDINAKMLAIAKSKAKQEKLNLKFLKGDMRTINLGQFDAVLTIFNSIGHLTRTDFEKTLRNVHRNLKEDGLYLFDIFNLNYLTHGNHITTLTIDWQEMVGDTKMREIQYSTITDDGILSSYDTCYEQKGSNPPKISKRSQTLQVYSAKQLKEMLYENGFEVLDQCGVDGSKFIETKTERLLTIAKKASIP